MYNSCLLLRLYVMLPASAVGSRPTLLLLTPAGGKVKLMWDKERWRLEWKSARFDEEESDKNKVVCRLCTQKPAYIHLDVNLPGEQAATGYWRYSADKYYNICPSDPQTLWSQPIRKDYAAHHRNDCLSYAATVFCWRRRLPQVNALYWAWVVCTESHSSNVPVGVQPHVFQCAQT